MTMWWTLLYCFFLSVSLYYIYICVSNKNYLLKKYRINNSCQKLIPTLNNRLLCFNNLCYSTKNSIEKSAVTIIK